MFCLHARSPRVLDVCCGPGRTLTKEPDVTELSYQMKQHSVQDLINRYDRGTLNLEPGFQRKSVWSLADRKKLIESIVHGYPLPAVFFYKRNEDGHTIYDVIDGKQRLESILMFSGEMRGQRFSAKFQLPGETEKREHNWRSLCRQRKQNHINDYQLQVIEIDGEMGDVVELFVRINSTGKALTSAEKQHAKYYDKSPFLRTAAALAKKMSSKLIEAGVLSDTQISRMKDVELMCELILSVHRGGPINEKAALDAAMKSTELTAREVGKAVDRTRSAIMHALKILPNLKSTRFRKLSDFYSLVVLLASLESERAILSDKKRNRLAGEILTAFSTAVDKLNDQRQRVESIDPELALYREYLLTVIQGTDKYNPRLKRGQILRAMIEPIFAKKDDKRLFTTEQRRILWNSTDTKICRGCRRSIGWHNFAADHVNPHSKGGRTELANAAVLCRGCNSSKGSRTGVTRLRRRVA